MAERRIRIVVVTGAGASRNLGAKGELPLMADWARILVKDVYEAAPGLPNAIGLTEGLGAEDFEDLVGSFLSWQAAIDLNERFAAVGNVNIGSVSTDVSTWINHSRQRAEAFTGALRKSLFREFGRDAIDEQAAAQAHSTLQNLLGSADSLVYATTNYDISIEVGLEEIGTNVNDGFKAARRAAAPELSLDEMIDWDSGHGGQQPVLHLHGAVGWYREPDGKILKHYPDLPYNPTLGAPVILPPDPNKDPVTDSSVSLLWDRFRTALRGATHILVIGHSLNDAPLVRVLREAMANATLAVTYFSTEPSGEAAEAARDRIKNRFPTGKFMVMPMSFEPELKYNSDGITQWLSK
jgi:hypothetical protein